MPAAPAAPHGRPPLSWAWIKSSSPGLLCIPTPSHGSWRPRWRRLLGIPLQHASVSHRQTGPVYRPPLQALGIPF